MRVLTPSVPDNPALAMPVAPPPTSFPSAALPLEEVGDAPDEVCLRWRGVVTGPHTILELEKKLADRQISMLHEVEVEDGWIPLRQYLARREARERASQLAALEQARANMATAIPLAIPVEESGGGGLVYLALGGLLLPPLAWVASVMAFLELRRIRKGLKPFGGRRAARWALWLGLGLTLLWFAALGVWIAFRMRSQGVST